jgi:hypothetical protein
MDADGAEGTDQQDYDLASRQADALLHHSDRGANTIPMQSGGSFPVPRSCRSSSRAAHGGGRRRP